MHPRNICEICNYVSPQPYIIKRHMFRHTSEGCTCEICGKTYKVSDIHWLSMSLDILKCSQVKFYLNEFDHSVTNSSVVVEV